MSNNQVTSGSLQQPDPNSSPTISGAVQSPTTSKDSLAANLTWASIKSAWQVLRNS
ncbi:MAG TPA: hypothetical protein VKZ53_02145 [Candidatus Angelobacter sp.]|nr:hypothetical protein [Candidatus Angelobacter sp.]